MVLVWTRYTVLLKCWLTVLVVSALFFSVVPLGEFLLNKLENRFHRLVKLPEHIEGIIVLGGVIDQFITIDRGMTSINGASERLIEFASLARRYPEAKLVFTGGSGVLGRQGLKEASFVIPLLRRFGLNTDRLLLEDQSKNTAENALFSIQVANPSKDGIWLIITSAFHMPRAIGSFRKVGWIPLAYPVDFYTRKNQSMKFGFNFRNGLNTLASSLHEWLGLTFYWLTGRTNEFFPRP